MEVAPVEEVGDEEGKDEEALADIVERRGTSEEKWREAREESKGNGARREVQ